MFDRWQLQDFDVGTAARWKPDAGMPDGAWVDVEVPGDTHTALVAAGRIQHPFRGRHERDASWIADREWWWRTQFTAAPRQGNERVELVFDGLDTFASVYLNGVLLGSTNNMFRSWRFDIGEQLSSGTPHELVVVFSPPSQNVGKSELPSWGPLSAKLTTTKRNLMRKAQFGWGWDWGPNLPTVGVWRPARLERGSPARLTGLSASTVKLSAALAELRVEVTSEAMAAGNRSSVELQLLAPDGTMIVTEMVAMDAAASTTFSVRDPQLWWTADLGTQPLYTVVARLFDDGTLIDTQSRRIGLRTIALDQSADPDEPGTKFFRFVLNGVPIFARGACWIPASSFVGALTQHDYRPLIEQAVRANMNMLRIWGGGIYEHDAFYDLCDQSGLLIWQDFMFACAPYPEDDAAFVANVEQEVRDQVQRLRHHPSLALWCGNNECQVIQDFFNTMSGMNAPLLGTLYYDRLIPEVLTELDPSTPYWPGSPSGGPSPNSMRAGDVHDWTVWHGIPPVPDDRLIGQIDRSPAGVAYTRYAEDMGRFISEFGIQSSPAMSMLRRWMEPDDLALGTEGFLERIKDEPKDKVNAMLQTVTGLPSTLEQYVDFTMLLQAEGLKFGLEHFRRRKPHCSGTLIWQYNDCWPCISWSLVDYDGVGKSSLYAVGRAYAPVLASFKVLDDGSIELWITNDTLHAISCEALIELSQLAGSVDWNVVVPFSVAANSSVAVWQRSEVEMNADRVLTVKSSSDAFAPNRHFFAAIRDLPLVSTGTPDITFEQISANELKVRLTADTYLLSVSLESPQASTRFSDNYFDLGAGEVRTIRVSDHLSPISAEALVIRCWNQHCQAH